MKLVIKLINLELIKCVILLNFNLVVEFTDSNMVSSNIKYWIYF